VSNRPRILIIEDNPADVRLISEALFHKGIDSEIDHLETADAGIQAVRNLETGSPNFPDLILLDYNLPGGTAKDVLLAIRDNPALTGVPKAVLTCSVAPKDREQALSTGADLFVYKPADLDEFLGDVGGAVAELLARPRTLAL
jgi:two-component system, cell cycle response regulator